ncbi:MAG: hypothetical protein C7B47_13225 [Sulfobacillus thermosulfidooxidans]|uniref:Uncharacterized protein n=1 Tax=Sulfobacillus thermosulfidooxidans TaxID=28034 RepID=A0A2T2WS23_SULTH|nr:MAG: hypothetical protein C7B47_13225 [Sulfobacillus thermosulfidooxidans]
MKWTVIGQGPSGLLAASFLTLHHERCQVVAAHEGTMSLWSGCFDKGDSEPICVLDENRQTMLWELWRQLFWTMGIPMRLGDAYTPTCVGDLKTTYLCPSWQYSFNDPESLWIVGFDGLPDSFLDVHVPKLQRLTGKDVIWDHLSKPRIWREDWGTVRWASFMETLEGKTWLRESLQLKNAQIPSFWPLLVPQVMGRNSMTTIQWLTELGNQLGRQVFEYPLVSPSLGGMRIYEAWQIWLKSHGVSFIRGTVTAYKNGIVQLEDGRKWNSDHVIMATGGILGGGINILNTGRIEDSVTHEIFGNIMDQELRWEEIFRLGFLRQGTVSACGRQRAFWNPDKDRNGGIMILNTVYQALKEQGLDLLIPEWKGGEIRHVGR